MMSAQVLEKLIIKIYLRIGNKKTNWLEERDLDGIFMKIRNSI